jgi:glycosyltransferase involved in cell wall biosynthesis
MTRPNEDIEAAATPALSVVVPIFNERDAVGETILELSEILRGSGIEHEIIAVDDCSDDGTREILEALRCDGLRVIRHGRNKGYGAALKTGVRAATHPLVAVTDADGTYPNRRIPELARMLGDRDMVVGARTGENVHIPWIRRPPKWFIGKLANYLARYKIPDINSGMRVFRRSVLLDYLRLLPDGFSFTTTITLAMLTRGHEVAYVPIDYAPRKGRSKIRPIYDTLNFVQLIIRTVLLFEPLRVFLPIAFLLLLGGAGAFAYSFVWLDKLLDATVILCVIGAIQILGIGMIADMVNRRLDR